MKLNSLRKEQGKPPPNLNNNVTGTEVLKFLKPRPFLSECQTSDSAANVERNFLQTRIPNGRAALMPVRANERAKF